MVDMDRQRSAGDSLGVRDVPDESTYAMAIAGQEVDLDECIYEVPFELERGTLHVMPIAAYDYESAVASLPNYDDNGLSIVSVILEPLLDEYDYIVMDLRPELSHFASSAMAAANAGVLVPVTSEITTAVHLQEVSDHIDYLAEKVSGVHALGVVRSRWDGKGEEARVVNEILADSGMHAFNTAIPVHKITSKSFAMTTGPVVTSYPKSSAANKFHELTAEIVARADRSR